MVALVRLLLLLLLVTLPAALQVFDCRRRPERSAPSENSGGGSEGVKAAENANDVLSRHSVDPSESLECGPTVAAALC